MFAAQVVQRRHFTRQLRGRNRQDAVPARRKRMDQVGAVAKDSGQRRRDDRDTLRHSGWG
jgi:hypothetical protein